MKIAITGASGFVGRQLVPRLLARGVALVLIGRNPGLLQERFPDCSVAGYDDIVDVARNCDVFLHLATLNNNQDATYEDFERVNVHLALEACRSARLAGARRFIYASSTHALSDGNSSFYARSKRAAVEQLLREEGMTVQIVYLPAVIGDELAGRLGLLARLPTAIKSIALSFLSALKPTVHIDRVAEFVVAEPGYEPKVLLSEGQERNLFYRAAKRAFDLMCALAIICLLWWAMIAIWVTVRLQSPGPGLFRQTRVGRFGQSFTCYKFRTMYVSTPNLGTHEVSSSAVTPTGAFLRRTKLDELPQVINILLNQMSLVGPRPCLPTQVPLVTERRKRLVLDVKPGITGLAQVNGIDMSDPDKLARWDEYYLKLRSILLDLKIVIQTAFGGGRGDNVQ